MAAPSNEDLQAQIRSLAIEIQHLRTEVERLKQDDVPAAAPAPAAPPPPDFSKPVAAPAPVAAPPPPPEQPKPEKSWEKAPVPAPGVYTGPRGGRSAKPWEVPARPAPRPSFSLDEKYIGEKLLQYAGVVILTLGIAFFLIWTAAHAGPAVRVLLAAGAGAALVFAGLRAEKRPPYDQLAGTLVGGGWTILYITAYAAGHWEPTRILDSGPPAVFALLAAAGGMIAHAVSRRSRPLRLYAVSLTYFVMLFCGADIPSFDLFLILFAGSAAVAAGTGEADVLIASLLGYYLNYASVYFHTISLPPEQHTLQNFLSPFLWLAGSYLIVGALPLIPKARRLFEGEQAAIAEAALCLNTALFAATAGSMGRVYFGIPHLGRAAALAALFAVPSLLYTRALSRRSAAAGLNAIVALALLAAAVFEMPDPMWKLLAWIGVSCGWVWIGLFFDQPVWRAAGLAMALLTFGFYWNVAAQGAESRRAASMALFLFTGLSYFFSRFHRVWLTEPHEWEKPSKTMWLHAGSLSLVLGLWGVLDAAPFLCALCALAIAAEHGAQELRRADLWEEAVVVELGLGIYSFFVDYGANAAVAGVSMRLWTTAVVLGTYAYLYFADVVDDALAAELTAWSKKSLRAALTWAASAVAAFAVYREFDGRLRLPVWALWSLGLYYAGRVRRETHFKHQSVLLAGIAGWEAGFTYLLHPAALLSPLDPYKALFYWGACAALLGGLFLAKERTWGEPSPLDEQAAVAFGLLPLVLGACYLGKELDRVQLTLAWTGLGLVFLVGGLALDWRELRRPGLGLLGLCVGKALLSDTANMPLPNRVASFVVLGLVLLFGSSLYVRAGSKDEKNPPGGPG